MRIKGEGWKEERERRGEGRGKRTGKEQDKVKGKRGEGGLGEEKGR